VYDSEQYYCSDYHSERAVISDYQDLAVQSAASSADDSIRARPQTATRKVGIRLPGPTYIGNYAREDGSVSPGAV
jgi:hypothetical protein